MNDRNNGKKWRLMIESRLYDFSEGTIKIADAMQVEDYSAPERRGDGIFTIEYVARPVNIQIN